jgi:hypothetical protein
MQVFFWFCEAEQIPTVTRRVARLPVYGHDCILNCKDLPTAKKYGRRMGGWSCDMCIHGVERARGFWVFCHRCARVRYNLVRLLPGPPAPSPLQAVVI